MRVPVAGHRFLGFFPPYRRLEVLDHPCQIPRSPLPNRGSVLLWNLKSGEIASGSRSVRARPPGVALFVILPPTSELGNRAALFRLMELCRPHSVLPHFQEADTEELVAVLRRFPSHFSVEVTDYLTWRGIEVDVDTRRLLRKTIELSGELRTVSGLARALYMSRRALGRRFMTKGLPVPSHWLHFGRILRGSLRLQNPLASLLAVASELGYPDGFAFSNQMKRLTGLRPSMMRECFGWEWVVESWLLKEAQSGSLAASLRRNLFPEAPKSGESLSTAVAGSRFRAPSPIMRVAEDAPESA